MINWDTYTNFSESFLTKHHDVVLMDTFHKIQSLVLYPPKPISLDKSRSEEMRQQIVLTLNLRYFNKIKASQPDPEKLEAINQILRIPEIPYFKENWESAYPYWLIEKEFERLITDHHFTMLHQLVMTLIRTGKTYENSWFSEPQASIRIALEVILGETPLKSERASANGYIGGEKSYRKYFNLYKFICPLMAALEHLRQEEGREQLSILSLDDPAQIERLLKLTYWFKEALIALKTRNTKNNSIFPEGTLLSLPNWVDSSGIHISIEILPEVKAHLDELTSQAILVTGKTRTPVFPEAFRHDFAKN